MNMAKSEQLLSDRSASEVGNRALGGVRRLSVTHFLVAVALLLVVVPFVDELPNGDLIEAMLFTLVLGSAVMAVGGRRRTLIIAAALVMPALLGKWIDHLVPGLIPKPIPIAAAIVFVAYIIAHLVRF